MTRSEQLLRARDQLQGIVAEAYVNGPRMDKDGPHDAALALKIRQAFAKIEQILNELERPTKSPVNGAITKESTK